MTPEEQFQSRIIFAVVIAVCVALWLFATAFVVNAHEARTVAGDPLNVFYPPGCCQSAATSPNGDCAPISDEYVTERADGYHINIPVGGHPKLKTKGYIGIVPYAGVKQPISNDYHICLSTDGATRFCFFPKPGAV